MHKMRKKKLVKKIDGILCIPFLLFHEYIRFSVTMFDMLVVSK